MASRRCRLRGAGAAAPLVAAKTNPLPIVAQADLGAGQLLNVAADGARTGRYDLLLRQEAYASAVDPAAPNSLTAASNSTSLCSAPMTSRNSLTIGIL